MYYHLPSVERLRRLEDPYDGIGLTLAVEEEIKTRIAS